LFAAEIFHFGGRSPCSHRAAWSDFNGSGWSHSRHWKLGGAPAAAGTAGTIFDLQAGQVGASMLVMAFHPHR
jgi:hypothetical protein